MCVCRNSCFCFVSQWFAGFSSAGAKSTFSCARSSSGSDSAPSPVHPIAHHPRMSRSILKDGQYFGESAVLASTKQVFGSQIASRRSSHVLRYSLVLSRLLPRTEAQNCTCCLIAPSYCVSCFCSYVLGKSSLQEILVFYPKMQRNMMEVVLRFVLFLLFTFMNAV